MKKYVNEDIWAKAWIKCSRAQGLVCCCGKLARPSHEMHCDAFHKKVIKEYEHMMLRVPDGKRNETYFVKL